MHDGLLVVSPEPLTWRVWFSYLQVLSHFQPSVGVIGSKRTEQTLQSQTTGSLVSQTHLRSPITHAACHFDQCVKPFCILRTTIILWENKAIYGFTRFALVLGQCFTAVINIPLWFITALHPRPEEVSLEQYSSIHPAEMYSVSCYLGLCFYNPVKFIIIKLKAQNTEKTSCKNTSIFLMTLRKDSKYSRPRRTKMLCDKGLAGIFEGENGIFNTGI